MKQMARSCIVGAIGFLLGTICGCVAVGGSLLAGTGLVLACLLALYMAFKSALEDGQWIDAHRAGPELAGEPEGGEEAENSADYNLGYEHGFDDAVETMQYTRPTRARAEKSKKPRRGA